MSAARPRLVQEGTPLSFGNEPKTLQGSSNKLLSTSATAKSKFRLVIGGEDDDVELPDDPEQQNHYSYGYNNNSFSNRGGRGGRYGDPARRQGSFKGQPPGRYSGRGYDQDSYSMDTSDRSRLNHSYNESGKRVIKNPKSQGVTQSRFVIGCDSDDAAGEEVSMNDAAGSSSNGMELEDTTTVIVPPTIYNEELHQIERMEGVIPLDGKEPLVVMDGANVAYAYADAMSAVTGTNKREPDYRGLLVAANYFLQWDIRVIIVLPAPWFRLKPRAGDTNSDNALMLTEKVEALNALKDKGLLVAAPPRDDDDAYALTIARREHARAKERGEQGGGHVLSNDMFRDAMARDADLEQWLQREWGRISFAFCDLGTMNDHGQTELDFIPNPRHPMVSDIERKRHAAAAVSS